MATRLVLSVQGMSCTGCENNVRFALRSLRGVEEARADHRAKRVEVLFDPSVLDESDVRRAIEDIGYGVVA